MDRNSAAVSYDILVARLRELLPGLKGQVLGLEGVNASGPMDEADLAHARYEREFAMSIRQHTCRAVVEILEALERLRAGRFGICEECGRQIGAKRLKAHPTAVLCVECKKELESEARRMPFLNAG